MTRWGLAHNCVKHKAEEPSFDCYSNQSQCSFRLHCVQSSFRSRGGTVSVLGYNLLRGLVFLGADGCLVVQDWWRSLCPSPPHFYAATSSTAHATEWTTTTTAKPRQWRRDAQLLHCEIIGVRESIPLLHEKKTTFFFSYPRKWRVLKQW